MVDWNLPLGKSVVGSAYNNKIPLPEICIIKIWCIENGEFSHDTWYKLMIVSLGTKYQKTS